MHESPGIITAKELSDFKESIILDIRGIEDYENWHIPGSLNVDVYEDIHSNSLHSAAQKLLAIKTDKKVIAVCNAGVTAKIACQILQSQGKNSAYLKEGMAGWNQLHKAFKVMEDAEKSIIQIARVGKGCLSYIIASKAKKECLVIDPSHFIEEYLDLAAGLGFKIKGVIETHIHADHVSGAKQLASIVNCEFYTPGESMSFTKIGDGSKIRMGNVIVDVIGTPGHTNESVCLIVNGNAVLTGDTLFLNGVGRPDLGRTEDLKSNAESLYNSLGKIIQLDGNLLVLPAHFQNADSIPVSGKLNSITSSDIFKKSKDDFIDSVTSNLQNTPPNYMEIKNINKKFSNAPRVQAEQLEFGPNRCVAN